MTGHICCFISCQISMISTQKYFPAVAGKICISLTDISGQLVIFFYRIIIKPRRACAARITVLGVCVPGNISLHELAIAVACKRQNICLKLRSRVMKYERNSYANYSSNYSGLPVVSFLRSTHSEAPQVTQP